MKTKIAFKPWVGKNYEQGFLGTGKKVMVLGESHYSYTPEAPNKSSGGKKENLTVDAIEDFVHSSEWEPYKNTYIKFERALAGKEVPKEERAAVWDSILFYNYVQTTIGTARQAPTGEDFKSSRDLFFEVVNQYQPDYIIVWGRRLYNHLPQEGKQGEELMLNWNGTEFFEETWEYTLDNGHTVKIMSVYHPSCGFSWDYWHEFIVKFVR